MIRFLAILAVLAVSASPAFASFGVNSPFTWGGNGFTADGQVTLSWNGQWHGGPFGVTGSLTGTNANGFGINGSLNYNTFCVESSVTFSPGTTYWASVNTNAYSGDTGNYNGDPISKTTENIFDNYTNALIVGGTTNAYNQALGFATMAAMTSTAGVQAISEAIWYAEGETGGVANSVYNHLGIVAAGNAQHTDALNLWVIAGPTNGPWTASDVQSQLIHTGEFHPVPLPGAALLGMLGLGAIGWMKRRFA